MPQSGDFSLYFHVPFCTKKCDYCHFYVLPDQFRYKELYMRALKKEWELRKHLIADTSPISIYFGGGTPALLSPKAIEEILSWISPSPSCEITLEANPENVSLESMQAFYKCGINRISLGVQTFDDTLLKVLSRTHSTKRSFIAVEEILQAGFSNISIDLMYDLPGQTLLSWYSTLEKVKHLPITHLSLYNLIIEPHTVFFKKKETLKLPDELLSFNMLQEAIKSFENCGLNRYEISAFAKQNFFSKHNMGYWTGRSFLGFGPSAFSYWNGSRFRNIANLNRYAKILDQNMDPIDFKETLTAKEKLKESLAVGLRLKEGVTVQSLFSEITAGLLQLEKEGFIAKNGKNLRLTDRGLLFHDTVAEHIMGL